MHLSRVGSRGCTGTHTVHRLFYLSLRQSAYLPTHIGAAFADLQPLPDLGVWHTSECKSSMSRYDILVALPLLRDDFPYFYHFIVPILFGTYNTTTATAPEVELSQSLQTAFANFVRDPNVSPAPNWPPYEPGFLGIARNPTLAKIAYEENVAPDDFINLVQPIATVSGRNDYATFTCL